MSNSEFMAVSSGMTDDDSSPMIRKPKQGKCVFYWAVIATIFSICLVIALIVVSESQKSSINNNIPSSPDASSQSNNPTVRWCTTSADEQNKCQEMIAAFNQSGMQPALACVMKDSTEECVSALTNSEADAFTADGQSIFDYYSSLKPILAENYGFGDSTYWSVAVVKKSDNSTFLTKEGLTGKFACHTGYQRRAGWNMPMGKLKELGIIEGCGDGVKPSVAELFGKVCAPGGGPELCKGCIGSCARSCEGEPYCRYNGAFRCMAEVGDVAFVKQTTVYANTDGNSEEEWTKNLRSSDYELLCPNGKRASLADYEVCNLGKVPARAVVVSANAPSSTTTQVSQLLLIAQMKFGPVSDSVFKLFGGETKNLLFKSSTELLIPLHEGCSSERFLGSDYWKSMSLLACKNETHFMPDLPFCVLPQYSSKISTTLRWCTTSDLEQQKCSNISAITKSLGNPLHVVCIQEKGETDCGEMVGQGAVDLANLDGGHIYSVGRKYNIMPIAAEYYGGGSETDKAASYYVVAVIKASDQTTKLTTEGLRGKKTCHTGYGKTSGWNVPVGYFASSNIIPTSSTSCDITKDVENFFGGSCVPGVKKEKYPKLCSICNGTGSVNCTSQDPYKGYTGALKCLEDGAGEIAFINHVTLMSAKNQSQFKLLCKNGSTASPSDYKTCNLEQVASHALVTSRAQSTFYKEKVWALLYELQKVSNGSLFSSNGGKDLLFKDNTKCLWRVQEGCSWYDYLGQDYVKSFKALNCDPGTVPSTTPCTFVKTCL